MSSKESLRQRFAGVGSRRQYGGLRVGREASDLLAFMESSIKREFESFSLLSTLCGGERRMKVDAHFQAAFLACSLEERLGYYQRAVEALSQQQGEPSIQLLAEREVQFDVLPVKVAKGLKSGPNYKIKLSQYIIDCAHYEIPLARYLLRRSRKSKQAFVFESMAEQEPALIRLELAPHSSAKEAALLAQNMHNWSKYVVGLNRIDHLDNKVKLSKKQKEASEASPSKKPKEPSEASPSKHPVTSLEVESRPHLDTSFPLLPQVERSVIQEVFQEGGEEEEEIYQLVEQKELQLSKQQSSKSYLRRWRKNVAAVLLPQLSLLEIQHFDDYLPVVRDDSRRLYIYQHSLRRGQFRMELYLQAGAEAVVRQLCEVQNYKLWNGSVNESLVKLSISSDNAYLVYLKQRAYSHLYRERDFLFLRHLCRQGQAHFIVDSSVHHPQFIPFTAIQRATLHHCLTKIEPAQHGHSRLLMDLSIDYGGVLQAQAQSDLTLRFLKEFAGLQSHIARFKGEFKCAYDLEWDIPPQVEAELSNSRHSMTQQLFDQPLSSLSLTHNNIDDDDFYSIADQDSPPPMFELTEQEFLQSRREAPVAVAGEEVIELNAEGLVILPRRYLSVKHATAAGRGEERGGERRRQQEFSNLMLRGDFAMCEGGGMRLTNEVKAAAQNNVIKFIMSTIKKNLFSGKGILNISLPVEIFNCYSNLQRLCEALSMAPDLLEKRGCAAGVGALGRFKACVAFAFSASVLYFDIDKPFNPILGETFQGFIDGCPIYGEQISHHPPISSLLLVGRGYRVYGNLEAKVYVHLNSGEGVNEGFSTVEFDDGGRVVFQTAPGEVSGLAVGDRKFRFKGKTYVMDPKNRLFCAINFEDEAGLFSSKKWKFEDQMDGEIVRVTESFVRAFFESKSGKEAITPGKKDIQERLGKVGGRWLQSFLIDGEEYFNLQQVPHEMVHYQFPLPSNSDYREDLLYRKKNDLARSQNEKERLEVLQRGDRKFREKYHPAKH